MHRFVKQPRPDVQDLGDGRVRIPLTQGRFAVIDASDLDKVSKHSWILTTGGKEKKTPYARARDKSLGGGRNVFLQRLLLNPGPGQRVRFKDNDTLNCTRANMVLTDGRWAASARLRPRKAGGKEGKKTHNTYHVSAEAFVTAWENSETPDEVARRLSMPKPIVMARASNYRKIGVKLKKLSRRGRKINDVSSLNRLIDSLRLGEGAADAAPPERRGDE